jgi:hypothetical protein
MFLKAPSTETSALFAWLISYQPAVLFSQNKPATSNQPTVLFSPNKSAPAISHQPNEQADHSMSASRLICNIPDPDLKEKRNERKW